ncbi:hypothetical protein HYH03_004183 [Edaphochlamys debaryana]|uniref:Thioredoxin domain-containing protein n=1 Tax=Edaphochlamys debaryana TaxID=47281 RepID=A0A836C3Q0_9CHLO|nr:hypothetical protein HYH03_004183 [Edaphochlamys debaryana]|eukprot:KAG2497919.1 hypothetical protein HYH03_004183 [Edaphochlamys debaryana]
MPSDAAGDAAPAVQTASARGALRRGIVDDFNFLLSSNYYGLNVLLTSTYVLIRAAYANEPLNQTLFGQGIQDFASWERYVAFICGSYVFFRLFKARSRLAALILALDFIQIFVGVMAFSCNPMLFGHLAAAYLLIFLLFPKPVFPLHEYLEQCTPESMAEDVKQPNTDITWVVYFYTPYHTNCLAMDPVMADLSFRYASDKLRFGMMDVGEFNRAAVKLGLDVALGSPQMPTVALFEKGEEVARLPQKRAGGSGLYYEKWGLKDAVKVLELDARFAKASAKAGDKKGQ